MDAGAQKTKGAQEVGSQMLASHVAAKPLVPSLPPQFAQCLQKYDWPNGGIDTWPDVGDAGIDRVAAAAQLAKVQRQAGVKKLLLFVHNSQNAVTRRVWNAAGVLAALRSSFPAASGVHVVAWDVSLTAARDLALLSQLYQRADVVVTGAGLHTVQHVLLKDDSVVVDLETRGVCWENIDMKEQMADVFAQKRVLPYEALLLQAGVLPLRGERLRDLDYAAIRANSDYRVNPRALIRAVGVALSRVGYNGDAVMQSSYARASAGASQGPGGQLWNENYVKKRPGQLTAMWATVGQLGGWFRSDPKGDVMRMKIEIEQNSDRNDAASNSSQVLGGGQGGSGSTSSTVGISIVDGSGNDTQVYGGNDTQVHGGVASSNVRWVEIPFRLQLVSGYDAAHGFVQVPFWGTPFDIRTSPLERDVRGQRLSETHLQQLNELCDQQCIDSALDDYNLDPMLRYLGSEAMHMHDVTGQLVRPVARALQSKAEGQLVPATRALRSWPEGHPSPAARALRRKYSRRTPTLQELVVEKAFTKVAGNGELVGTQGEAGRNLGLIQEPRRARVQRVTTAALTKQVAVAAKPRPAKVSIRENSGVGWSRSQAAASLASTDTSEGNSLAHQGASAESTVGYEAVSDIMDISVSHADVKKDDSTTSQDQQATRALKSSSGYKHERDVLDDGRKVDDASNASSEHGEASTTTPSSKILSPGAEVLNAAYVPRQIADHVLADQSFVTTDDVISSHVSTLWSDRRDHRWEDELASIVAPGFQLDPSVRSVLLHVFPPSSHACYGLDAETRTCHYTHVVAYKSKFYYVQEEPPEGDGEELFVWLSVSTESNMPLEFIHRVTYEQLFGMLTKHLTRVVVGDNLEDGDADEGDVGKDREELEGEEKDGEEKSVEDHNVQDIGAEKDGEEESGKEGHRKEADGKEGDEQEGEGELGDSSTSDGGDDEVSDDAGIADNSRSQDIDGGEKQGGEGEGGSQGMDRDASDQTESSDAADTTDNGERVDSEVGEGDPAAVEQDGSDDDVSSDDISGDYLNSSDVGENVVRDAQVDDADDDNGASNRRLSDSDVSNDDVGNGRTPSVAEVQNELGVGISTARGHSDADSQQQEALSTGRGVFQAVQQKQQQQQQYQSNGSHLAAILHGGIVSNAQDSRWFFSDSSDSEVNSKDPADSMVVQKRRLQTQFGSSSDAVATHETAPVDLQHSKSLEENLLSRQTGLRSPVTANSFGNRAVQNDSGFGPFVITRNVGSSKVGGRRSRASTAGSWQGDVDYGKGWPKGNYMRTRQGEVSQVIGSLAGNRGEEGMLQSKLDALDRIRREAGGLQTHVALRNGGRSGELRRQGSGTVPGYGKRHVGIPHEQKVGEKWQDGSNTASGYGGSVEGLRQQHNDDDSDGEMRLAGIEVVGHHGVSSTGEGVSSTGEGESSQTSQGSDADDRRSIKQPRHDASVRLGATNHLINEVNAASQSTQKSKPSYAPQTRRRLHEKPVKQLPPLTPLQQQQLLTVFLAQLELADLPRAVIAYPKIARNLYHWATETLSMVHRTLCYGLGACRYWGEGPITGQRVASNGAKLNETQTEALRKLQGSHGTTGGGKLGGVEGSQGRVGSRQSGWGGSSKVEAARKLEKEVESVDSRKLRMAAETARTTGQWDGKYDQQLQGGSSRWWQHVEGPTWDDPTWDPSLNVASDPTDFSIILWAETYKRWELHHKFQGRPKVGGETLPVGFDLLRCYHPDGALWMTQDHDKHIETDGIVSMPNKRPGIGRAANVFAELNAAGISVPPGSGETTVKLLRALSEADASDTKPGAQVLQDQNDHGWKALENYSEATRKLLWTNRPGSRFGNIARLGLGEQLEEWSDGQVFRVGHLVGGMGPYVRHVWDHPGPEMMRLQPFPASLQLSWKRRMMSCIGEDWERSLRPDLDNLEVQIHNRHGLREFLNIEKYASSFQQFYQGLVAFNVAESGPGPLAEQAQPFLSPAVTVMSHGAALGHFVFVPMLSSWIDVTFGRYDYDRRFIRAIHSQLYAWNIPVVEYYAEDFSELKFSPGLYDGIVLWSVGRDVKKRKDHVKPKEVVWKLKHAHKMSDLAALRQFYGLSEDVERNLFLFDSQYTLDKAKLQAYVREALKAVVLRLLPDILEGNILLENPGSFVRVVKMLQRSPCSTKEMLANFVTRLWTNHTYFPECW